MNTKSTAHRYPSISSSNFFAAACAAIIIISSTTQFAQAALKLGSTFSDNMVLQRDQDIIVWGEATPGQPVQVQLANETSTATPDDSGHWKTTLKPLPPGGLYTAKITSGSESIELRNILSGDVWLCAGQSNMQFGVAEDVEADQMKAQAHALPNLRLLSIPKLGADKPTYMVDAHWEAADSPAIDHFSAVAVHLGLALSQDPRLRRIPIGLIDSSFGGTSAEGWVPTSALQNFSKDQFSLSMFNLQPGALYNNMIAPLGPLSLTGIVWYQGENNSGKSQFYPAIMHDLIVEWRKQFHQDDLPFIIVQLPPFTDLYAGFPFTWLRDAQRQVAAENPNTGLVVSIDTTNGFNLHPREKGEIGRRAALQALRLAYHQDIPADGPTFKSATRDGNAMRITFDQSGGMLETYGEATHVLGFTLAGEDGIFHYADATLKGDDTVIARSPDVPDPKYVRYAWAAVPTCNLYNSAGLPAGPFRTDNLPPTVPVEIKPVIPSRRVATDLYDIVITGNGDIASLGVDKQQFISNDLENFGNGNFLTFFGPHQLQHAEQLTPNSISFSDLGIRETFSFAPTSITLQIQNLSKNPADKVPYHLHLAPAVHIAANGNTFDLTRNQSHIHITGPDTAKDDPNGGTIDLNINGNTTSTITFNFSKSD